MTMYSRKDWQIAALVTLIIFVVGACTLTPGIPAWGDDHAAYINEGIAIAEGRFEEQTRINYSYHPSELPDEAGDGRLVYVWGYPLMIAGVYKIIGFDRTNYSSVILYKIIPLLSLSLTGGALTLLFRKRFSLYVAAGAALVFCMSGDLFEALNTLYSDPLFLFFSVLTLLLMEWYAGVLAGDGVLTAKEGVLSENGRVLKADGKVLSTDSGSTRRRIVIAIAYGISMWMTHETRLSGFTVCAVALIGHVVCIIREKARIDKHTVWQHLLPYLIFAALVLASEHLWLAPATPNISDLGKTAAEGENVVQRYILKLSEYFDSLPRIPVEGMGYVFIAACVIGILLKGFTENLHLTLLLAGTLAVVLSLPYFQGLRYLYNVLPIMIMYCLYGFQAVGRLMEWLWKDVMDKAGKSSAGESSTGMGKARTIGIIRTIGIVVGLEILFFSCANQVYRAGYNFTHWNERFSYDVYSDEALEVYQYIKEEIPKEAIIAFGKPRALYLNTGRKGFWAGLNGHKIEDAQYYLRHKVTDFDEGTIDTSGMEVLVDNDVFTLYRV